MKNNKKISSIIVVLTIFINTQIITSQLISTTTQRYPLVPKDQTHCLQEGPNLVLTHIQGGIGLTLTLKNSGKENISNINIEFQVNDGFIIKPSNNHHNIPLLTTNQSTKVGIRFFGIGLGLIFNTLPSISITINAFDTTVIEKTAIVKIFGPFIKIIQVKSNNTESEGYTLYPAQYSKNTYLINMSGDIVHMWESRYVQGMAGYLLENGNLLRCDLPKINPTFFGGGITGRVAICNWNNTLIWDFEYSDTQHCLHHDVEMLPNGNILMVAWERKTEAEAILAGRNPNTLIYSEIWPDYVIEVEPLGNSSGNIVWEWHVWDHLIQDYDPTKENYGVVTDHPELIDINVVENILYGDWNHINSIDYNETYDQILLSCRNFNEIWVIDHSTTTEEAAGHTGGNSGKGGDLLYRWGNPQTYQTGTIDDQRLFSQHDASWIASGCPGNGNILIFNNGVSRPDGQYSTIEEIIPPMDSNGNYSITPGYAYDPEQPIWRYKADPPTNFYAYYLSGAQRLPDGNTLICDGVHGIFFEVTYQKEIVWIYINDYPDPIFNTIFSFNRYAPDYPGLTHLK